ncbi:MAG TPA: fibronectin type III domain-containing protein, partial [Opitutaceae bacterium]|nr:fibronectin type III domain-containing protein [Opitutaceae bacterium]
WVDTVYSMPSSNYGTRSNLDYTDARWVENGRTYYYIVTAIGSNSAEVGGTNESDPALATDIVAAPQSGLSRTPHIYVTNGDSFNEIGSAVAGSWFSFQPALAGATGAVTWALLDENDSPYTPPAGLAFNSATGELSGQPAVTPSPTRLRFRATAANGTATRDFVLNNAAWPITGGTTRPNAPTNVVATAGDGYVHLTWTASTSPGVVGYCVYRAELPRTQQSRRVYLSAGSPVPQRYDYVHLEKRILTADPHWAHPRVRSGRIDETWRADSSVTLARVAHPGTIPGTFRFPGETCMRATASGSEVVELGGAPIFYPDSTSGEAQWYSQLEPGRRYRYEIWMRQSGLGSGGQVTLTFNQYYATFARTFTVDDTWRLYGFEFTAPARPTDGAHGFPVIRFTGPGQLWFDNIRLFRADTDADLNATLTPPSPLVFDELMASQPLTGEKGMLRSMYVMLNQATMASCLSLHRDAYLTMNWYQEVSRASNMTLPYFLQYAYRSGTSAATRMRPWLNISSHMREDEWLALVEYLGAPIDPTNPADVAAKPWAYLRYQQRGITTPWTDEFSRVYLEFANETWHNGAVSDEWFGWGRSGWVHSGAREFGLAAHHFTGHVRDHSPYYAALNSAGKLRFVMGSNYEDYAEIAAAGAPLAHAIAHTSYVGPKWEVGETPLATYDDHGIQATLLGHAADTAHGFVAYRRQREQLAAAGHAMDLLGYEGGPSGYSLPGQDASPEAHDFSERYGKSLAMGVAALDAWLAAYEAGFSDQAYLGMGIGDYWSSHTAITDGYRPHAGWLALTLRNRFATGRMIRAAVVQAPTIVWDGAEYPLVSSYAFRDGNRLGIFLLSRKLGGSHDNVDWGSGTTPVTLVLPANPTGTATLYHLSGDPRATNLAAMNVTIQQTTATLARETTINLPQGSIYLYVVDTDLPDRDDPPAPPATAPTIAHASGGTTLSWPAVDGATSYTVFRSAKPYFDRGDVTETFTAATNTFTDEAAGGGTTYYYRVAANNGWGTGFWTLVAAGGANPATPVLPAPALDGLLESTGALIANWHEVPGASGYRVGLATRSGGPYTWTDAGIATGWTLSGLENGRTYYVAVYAYSAAGRSPDSPERSGTPLVAGQPAVLAAWDGAVLNYSANLANPPTILPVARHQLAVTAGNITRGAGVVLDTNNYGFPAGQGGVDEQHGHYDGKFPFYPGTDDGNFGATGGGSLANAIARELYIGTTVTPGEGQTVALGELQAGFQYSYGGHPLSAVLRYRLGSGVWHELPIPSYAVATGAWVHNDFTLALSGEPALQTITEPLELRLYLYWTGDDARWHPAALTRTTGEDLILRGTATTFAAPGQPNGLRSAVGRHQVALSWTPVAGATSYTVRWGTAPGVYTGSASGLVQATTVVGNLAGDVLHYFTVEALNAFGTGPTTAPLAATPLTSFQSWQRTTFTDAQRDAGLAATDADPDADGATNIVEYAFGTSPLSADQSPTQVILAGAPPALTATLPLWAEKDDIVVTVEASADLVAWTPLARSTAGTPMVPLLAGVAVGSSGTAPSMITVRDAVPSSVVGRRFLRVSVSRQ